MNLHILDLGCGTTKNNAIRVDINFSFSPDVVANLDGFYFPFKENTFSTVICSHIIEHIEDIFNFFDELWRISKPGAYIFIRVPYFSCVHSFCDITHKRFFTYYSLEPFYRHSGYIKKSKVLFKKIKIKMKFRTIFRILGLETLFNAFPRFYEKYFPYIFPAKEIEYKFQVIK